MSHVNNLVRDCELCGYIGTKVRCAQKTICHNYRMSIRDNHELRELLDGLLSKGEIAEAWRELVLNLGQESAAREWFSIVSGYDGEAPT